MIAIVPKPNGSVSFEKKCYSLPKHFGVDFGGFESWCVRAFCERTDCCLDGEAIWMALKKDAGLSGEAYRLTVTDTGTVIHAASEHGVVWALASLYQLMKAGSIPMCQIYDQPKYGHRGLSLDCARHYFPVAVVEQIIDQISLVKMNVLHWHLTDDQAWRIETRAFPKLHETSGDYYTQKEIREIVEYARIRGIEVVPEIELPGHTTGILAAYPEYGCFGKKVSLATAGGVYPVILCAGKEAVFAMIEELLDEICPLFPSKRFHIGGDEVLKSEWDKCPDCRKRMEKEGIPDTERLQGYFTSRVARILKKHGKHIICWNDALKAADMPKDIQIQYYSPDCPESMMKYCAEGGRFLYSDTYSLYFDYPHGMIPLKKVYHCSPRIGRKSYAGAEGMMGLEACLWTEHIHTAEQLGRHLFPRVYAAAEAAWTEKLHYADFKKRIAPLADNAFKAGLACTGSAWWDPTGKARRQESLEYFATVFATLPDNAGEQAGGNAATGLLSFLSFLTRVFRLTDIPYVLLYLQKARKQQEKTPV